MGSAASAVLSIAGGIAKSTADRDAGREQQYTDDWNAQVAELQAADATERGNTAETQSRIQTRQVIGAQRAGLAGQGVVVGDAGSTGDQIQLDTQRTGEQNALTIRNNAAREAWGFLVQAQNLRQHGDAALRQGRLAAATDIIGGGTQAANNYYAGKSSSSGSSSSSSSSSSMSEF